MLLRSLALGASGVLLLGLLLGPVWFTSRGLGPDWTVHLFALWKQSRAINALGHPSLFFSTDLQGALFPHYAFYGGSLYAAFGWVASLLGGRTTLAYCLAWTTGTAATFGGWTWLASQAGLRGWRAYVPGLFAITTAYYLTLIYARAAWGEFMATSMLPLAIAAGVWLLRAPRWRVAPLALFLASVVILTGSHNITLVWGAIFVALLGALAVFAFGRSLGGVRLTRVAAVLGVSVLAVAINAWFLAPNLSFAQRTLISAPAGGVDAFWAGTSFFNTPAVLLNPLRHSPVESSTPGLYLQLPVLVIVWLAVVGAVAVPRARATWVRRLAAGLWALFFAYLALHMIKPLWLLTPAVLRYIQFPMRLQPYLAMCLAGLLVLTLVALEQRTGDRTRWVTRANVALGAILAFGLALGVWQAWSAPSFLPTRDLVYADARTPPPSWYDPGLFRDGLGLVVTPPPDRQIAVPFGDGDTLSAELALPPGDGPFRTNIGAGTYLLEVQGLRPVGRTGDGFLVATRVPGDTGATTRVEVAPATSGPVVVGRYLTFAALLAAAALLIGVAFRRSARERS